LYGGGICTEYGSRSERWIVRMYRFTGNKEMAWFCTELCRVLYAAGGRSYMVFVKASAQVPPSDCNTELLHASTVYNDAGGAMT
jgi:hypothetical protein